MSAVLERYAREATLLGQPPAYEQPLLGEPPILSLEELEAGSQVIPGVRQVDLANDVYMQLPPRIQALVRKSEELRAKGLGAPRAGFGPFLQMVDGAVMLADQTAVTGTTETAVFPVAQFTGWAANQLRAGQKWFLIAYGIMTTAGASQGNITVTPRYGTSSGGVAMGASVATALAASASNVPWWMTYNFTIRQGGNAGTNAKAIGAGDFGTTVAAITAATGNTIYFGSTASVSIDLTIAAGLYIGVTLGSASDTMTTMDCILVSYN